MSDIQNNQNNPDLSKLKVTDLKVLCKEKGLPVSGTKQELIQRLNGETPVKTEKSKVVKPKKVNQTLEKPVFTKYLQQLERTPIVIKRNIHGNFEHLETGLVFNSDKRVIGVQKESKIESLGISDLENVYKFHFEMEPGVKVQEQSNAKILEDESLKEKRVQELLEITNTN
jgi:hypothetical protein